MNLVLNVINFCYQDPKSGHEYVFNSVSGRSVKRATGLATALAESGINWDSLAKQLMVEGYPTVASFLAGCDFDATVLVGKLTETRLFDDKFLKRAQLAARMMNDALTRRCEIRLAKIDQLTICCGACLNRW